MKQDATHLPIAAVEREVGLSKDVLRVWERRYGFPAPVRNAHGERVYPPDQVRRLRLVKRLMDQGMRPGSLLSRNLDELVALDGSAVDATALRRAPEPASAPVRSHALDDLLASIRAHDVEGLSSQLQQRLAQHGLALFVHDTLGPLARRVGDEWAHGSLEVFEEHLFTEAATRVLRQAIATIPRGRRPVVLMTTVPVEVHGLGLLMGEAMLSLHGARCINLGTQVPPMDIAHAAAAYEAEVVALSFSAAFAVRRIPDLLRQLRASLPAAVALWAAGAGVRRLSPVEGVHVLGSMDAALAALEDLKRPTRSPADESSG